MASVTPRREDSRLFYGFDFRPLNIFQHGIASSLFKSAFEVSATDGQHGSQPVDGYAGVDIFFDVCLGVEDGGIVVGFLAVKNYKGRLAIALDIDLEAFGAAEGYVAARIFLNQV